MLERLRVNQIKYAYFHVLTTAADGTLKLHKPENAQKITKAVHAEAPETKAIAWVYIGSAPQNGGVNLIKPEVRAALKPDKLLSVDTPMWYPFTLWGWSDDYFKEVAKRCDQICVMGYDSFLY